MESSLCDVCCYCYRSIQGTCCSLLLLEVNVQKFVLLFSTIGRTADSTLAVLWPMTRSQEIETQSELLRMFSSLVQLHWFKLLAIQMACCPSLNGHSEFLVFVESLALFAKVLVLGFLQFQNLKLVWAYKSSCMKAVDSNQYLNTIKFAARSRWSCSCIATAFSVEEQTLCLLNSELQPIPDHAETQVESKG